MPTKEQYVLQELKRQFDESQFASINRIAALLAEIELLRDAVAAQSALKTETK
jgi:hypothetical protein